LSLPFWRWYASLLTLALFLAACMAARPAPELPAAGADGPALPALDPEEVAQGKIIYDIYCAACHGANLEGEAEWQLRNEDGSFRAPPHDATGHTWHHSDRILHESVALGGQRIPPALGSSHMPAFTGILTDEEIAAVLAYIKSSWPPEIRQIQWEMTLQDEAEER
jgi:S-disulfanyl-L-cysteine oxidoreductase SoxD